MNRLLLLCFLSLPHLQMDMMRLALPLRSQPLIHDYRNSNFSQKAQIEKNRLVCQIETCDYTALARPFRILVDADYIERLPNRTAGLTRHLLAGSVNLSEYIGSCSTYLRQNIRYRETMSSDDPEQIIASQAANCIGYCSLFQTFLRAGSISSKVIRGFYLQREAGERVRLVPHRWLEITLNEEERIFFDPQYQSFGANYIKTDDAIQFTKIRKFAGRLLKRSQRLSN